jgi:hypothetical protein
MKNYLIFKDHRTLQEKIVIPRINRDINDLKMTKKIEMIRPKETKSIRKTIKVKDLKRINGLRIDNQIMMIEIVSRGRIAHKYLMNKQGNGLNKKRRNMRNKEK